MTTIKQIPLHADALDNGATQGTVTCDRCGIRAGLDAWIAEEYLVGVKEASIGALCPDCALDTDPNHYQGSWLLTW